VGKILAVAVIGAGILAVSQKRMSAIIGTLLGVTATVAIVLGPAADASPQTSLLTPTVHGLLAVFLLFVCGCVFWELFHEQQVSVGSVSGALCIYLLLGVAFGSIYQLLDWIDPEAFAGLHRFEAADESRNLRSGGMLYFSFVTLTTLGYGDVTPVASVARNLAMIEALLGQIVLVAPAKRELGHLDRIA